MARCTTSRLATWSRVLVVCCGERAAACSHPIQSMWIQRGEVHWFSSKNPWAGQLRVEEVEEEEEVGCCAVSWQLNCGRAHSAMMAPGQAAAAILVWRCGAACVQQQQPPPQHSHQGSFFFYSDLAQAVGDVVERGREGVRRTREQGVRTRDVMMLRRVTLGVREACDADLDDL